MQYKYEKKNLGFLYLTLAAALWGLIGPVSKIVFNHGMNPLESAFWRGLLASVAFSIHWFIKRYPLPSAPKDWLGLICFGVFGVGALEASFVLAVDYGGAALASVLLYSAPIWVNLVSFFIFKEKIPRRRWLALTVTLSGVVGVCTLGSVVNFSSRALFWGILSGLSYAGFYISGKIFFKRLHPVVVYMLAFSVASIAILPLMLTTSNSTFLNILEGPIQYPWIVIAACCFIGIICTYLPYLLYGFGLRSVEPGRAAIITAVEPVVAVMIANLVLGERFSVLGYLFSILVIIGVALS